MPYCIICGPSLVFPRDFDPKEHAITFLSERTWIDRVSQK